MDMNNLSLNAKDFFESIGVKGTPMDWPEPKPIQREEEEKFPIIPCPVCGSSFIKQVRKYNDIIGPGSHSWIVSEYCEDCGVMLAPNRKKRTHP